MLTFLGNAHNRSQVSAIDRRLRRMSIRLGKSLCQRLGQCFPWFLLHGSGPNTRNTEIQHASSCADLTWIQKATSKGIVGMRSRNAVVRDNAANTASILDILRLQRNVVVRDIDGCELGCLPVFDRLVRLVVGLGVGRTIIGLWPGRYLGLRSKGIDFERDVRSGEIGESLNDLTDGLGLRIIRDGKACGFWRPQVQKLETAT